MLKKIGSFVDWITWKNNSLEAEWNTWEVWQRHQLPSHFKKSEIFQYYLTYRPEFKNWIDKTRGGYGSRYYLYCFGEFSCLITSQTDVYKYINLYVYNCFLTA